jgi:hypothetical protein
LAAASEHGELTELQAEGVLSGGVAAVEEAWVGVAMLGHPEPRREGDLRQGLADGDSARGDVGHGQHLDGHSVKHVPPKRPATHVWRFVARAKRVTVTTRTRMVMHVFPLIVGSRRPRR